MKLIEQLEQTLKRKHFSPQTFRVYRNWVERFLRFSRDDAGEWRHPNSMGRREIEAFLNHLAVNRKVSASTQNQAFNAILFLYREVLDIQLENIDAMRAHERKRLPTVLSRNEEAAILEKLDHPWRLMMGLLYGSGLRLHECCTLRIKDVDTDREQITLRATKGNKDRLTLIPSRLTHFLSTQIEIVTDQHQRDLSADFGDEALTVAIAGQLSCKKRSFSRTTGELVVTTLKFTN